MEKGLYEPGRGISRDSGSQKRGLAGLRKEAEGSFRTGENWEVVYMYAEASTGTTVEI